MKPEYDEAVASRVKQQSFERPAAFVGMPSACRDTFAALPNHVFRVFHEVDAPPHAHNRELLRHYSLAQAGPELMSSSTSERIESEIHAADAVLSPSSVVTKQLREVAPDANVIQIPYGVDHARFAPLSGPRSHEDSASRSRRDGVRAVYVGQISYRKGLPFLMEAARSFRGTIELVGPVVRGELLERMPSNVRYLGVLASYELRQVLGRADAFVFPSVEDNFGLAVLEALSAGLPVITTDAVGAVDVIPVRDVDLVPPGDHTALSEALGRICPLEPDERSERAQRARVSGAISWQEYGERVVAMITNGLD